MNVRMATINDIDMLIKARFDYFAAEKWEITNDMRISIASQLQQYYPKHLNLDFFAAFVENDCRDIASIAFLVISEKPANLFFPTGKTGMILNVLTYPEYRRMGYATNAMNLLIEEAKRQNLSYIELSASDSGKPLYKKLGFQELKSNHFGEMKLSLL
jgi:ribosomal protein S18 acetylase RimI-like enzyme